MGKEKGNCDEWGVLTGRFGGTDWGNCQGDWEINLK